MSLIIQIFLVLWIFLCPVNTEAGSCGDFAQSGCRIDIELHKSFIKRTDEPITRVSIADPRIANMDLVTPRQVLIIAKDQVGTTSLTLWHGDQRAEVYDVRVYVPDSLTKIIQNRLRRLAPGALVRVWSTNTGVILDGEVESQEMLDRVLSIVKGYVGLAPENNLVTIRGSQQVQLEVKIAEVSRSGIKRMGLSFLNSGDLTVGVFPSGSVTGSLASEMSRTPTTITETVDAVGNYTKTTSGGGLSQSMGSEMEIASPFESAFQVALHAVNDDTLAILSLLKQQGLSRILASPNLVTMSGQEADFMVGGEYPYPVQGELGTVGIEYKRFGVMLRFTPTVVGRETITIQVEPEVSSLDFSLSVSSGGVAVPGLRTRRGSTTLQLKDGQTFAMAGLLNEEIQTTVSKIPFLGDIPILGSLFTSKEFQKNESELLIIVTPRLVRAMNRDEVPLLPGEGRNDNVSDLDFFFLNRVGTSSRTPFPELESDTGRIQGFTGETGFSR